jgi:hypothetical protein
MLWVQGTGRNHRFRQLGLTEIRRVIVSSLQKLNARFERIESGHPFGHHVARDHQADVRAQMSLRREIANCGAEAAASRDEKSEWSKRK